MEEEKLDHNTALHHLIETGDSEEVAMILGHKDRLRCGGVIRTGVKVPNSKCTDAERKLFSELEAQGLGYAEIDRKMGGEPKTKTSKLVPKNSDFFVVRDLDFTRPADAQYIRKHFADTDGKVRRFPVWFSVGEIDRVLYHGFWAFGGGGQLMATSFYDGKKLMVRYLPKDFKFPVRREDWLVAAFDPDNGPRDSKGSPLDPTGRKLDFGGFFRFNVPGLRGFDEITIPTRSWHGMSYSVALLRRVRFILGRFDGLLNGQPFFELVKSPEEITHDGKRGLQYIPVLELAVDPMELARYAEPHAVAARARTAMASLAGRPADPPPAPAPVPVAPPADTEAEARADLMAAQNEAGGETQADPFGNDDPARVAGMEYLHGAAKWCGVTWEQFVCWLVMEKTDGAALEDITVDELRKIAGEVKSEMTKDKAGFSSAVRAKAEEYGVGGEW